MPNIYSYKFGIRDFSVAAPQELGNILTSQEKPPFDLAFHYSTYTYNCDSLIRFQTLPNHLTLTRSRAWVPGDFRAKPLLLFQYPMKT